MTIDRLWLVRHGQSEGNVADQHAIESGSPTINIDVRDPDVPLSELGRRQAVAIGRRLVAVPPAQRPTLVVSSPFERAYATAKPGSSSRSNVTSGCESAISGSSTG